MTEEYQPQRVGFCNLEGRERIFIKHADLDKWICTKCQSAMSFKTMAQYGVRK